jgi:hypothetical protein
MNNSVEAKIVELHFRCYTQNKITAALQIESAAQATQPSEPFLPSLIDPCPPRLQRWL